MSSVFKCRQCSKEIDKYESCEFHDGWIFCQDCFNRLENNWKKRDADLELKNKNSWGQKEL